MFVLGEELFLHIYVPIQTINHPLTVQNLKREQKPFVIYLKSVTQDICKCAL